MWRRRTLRSDGETDGWRRYDDVTAEEVLKRMRDNAHQAGDDFWTNRFSILVDQPDRFIAIRAHSFDDGGLVIEILERQ